MYTALYLQVCIAINGCRINEARHRLRAKITSAAIEAMRIGVESNQS